MHEVMMVMMMASNSPSLMWRERERERQREREESDQSDPKTLNLFCRKNSLVFLFEFISFVSCAKKI
jgi:hypothetical protein